MVKLTDIAKKLNISLTTVSRALNDYDDVSSKTKELVKATAKEMGYVPNKTAQNLAMKKSHLISLLYDDYNESISHQSFSYEVIAGIRNYFGKTPYDLIIMPERIKDKDRQSLKDFCLSHRVDGIFVVGIRTDDSYIDEINEDFIPVVAVDYPLSGTKISYVESDNIKGCRLAVDYLISKGKKEIAFINGHDKAAISRIRFEGYKTALEKNSIHFNPDLVVNSDYTEAGGFAAANQLIEDGVDFNSIFIASDLMAIGARKALNDAGYQVPGDVAVVGFDDVFFAEYTQPGLTTIRQDKFQMGYQGAKLLHDIIENPDLKPCKKRIDVELIIRDSA